MAVETNARIEFSVASVEEWEKVNPKLHQGEPVFAKKPSGKYILKVGAPGGSTYKNAVVVWDQDDAETKMTSTQEAAAQALASKNVASAIASAVKASETAAAGSKSAAATSEANAKTSETNAAASKTAAANSASAASANATAAGNSASAAATSEKNAGSSASAAATSESNALKSASAASTSAGNAKTSETNASSSASAAKTSETAAAGSKSAAATSEANAKTSETNAAASANTAKAWSMSDSSPDGVTGNKSSKTWAGEAKTSASNASASASAAQFSANASSASATQSANSASASKSSANASASSASASANSASAASTSASNAKTSETNAANSAKAAKQSEENAKTWDPTQYTKYNETFPITTTGRSDMHNTILDLNDIKCLSTSSWECKYSADAAKIEHCPTTSAFFLFNLRNGASSASKDNTLANLTSSHYYIVQVLIDINGDVWRRACFNSQKSTFTFDKWKKAANIADLPTKTSQLTNDSNYVSFTDGKSLEVGQYMDLHDNTDMSVDYTFRLSADGSFTRSNGAYIRVLDSGHLSINGSELWIE